MKAILRISEAANLLGVSTKTIRRWDSAGKVHCFRTLGNHRRFTLVEIIRIKTGQEKVEKEEKTAIYARVSSHDQKKKGDLQRQIHVVQEHYSSQGIEKPQIFHDVGSGLNTKRRGFLRLCQGIEKGEINRVILTYPDRLTRFGFKYLERYFSSHGTIIQVLHQQSKQSIEEELVQDLISIVTSFSGRVHGLRSAKARKRRNKTNVSLLNTKCHK